MEKRNKGKYALFIVETCIYDELYQLTCYKNIIFVTIPSNLLWRYYLYPEWYNDCSIGFYIEKYQVK
jgi:hypothetical protein